LENNANACYLNSVLQGVLPLSALTTLVQQFDGRTPRGEKPFYTALLDCIRAFETPTKRREGREVRALDYFEDLVGKWQSLGTQQDAAEFLLYLLDGVHEECKWTADEIENGTETGEVTKSGLPEDSPVLRIFGGVTKSTVVSVDEKDSVSLEAFTMLALDVLPDAVRDIETALGRLCAVERISEKKTRRVVFAVLPKVLVLQMKRISYDPSTQTARKVEKPIKAGLSFEIDGRLVERGGPFTYSLYAAIYHHGRSTDGGHYTAVVRYNLEDPADREDCKWYFYDDTTFHQVSEDEVLRQAENAYMLIYALHGESVDLLPSAVHRRNKKTPIF
jgi:ubiquitin carboxyl-terminal hydrolase 10